MKLAATLFIMIINLFGNDLSIQDLGKITENFYIEYEKNKLHTIEAIKENKKNINSNSGEIAVLKLQIEKLQNTINRLQNDTPKLTINKPKESNIIVPRNVNEPISIPLKIIKNNSVVAFRSGALLKKAPIENAETIQIIPYQTSLEIDRCNQFGWCYINSFNGWIKKYTLLIK